MRSPVTHRTRSAAALVALTLALAACGSGDDAGRSPGNADVAVGGTGFGTADAATAKLGTDAKPGAFPRTITHARGTTQITAAPKRVVVLDTGELDDVLALGIRPVGIPSTKGASSTPTYLADKVEGVRQVGTIAEPNLEVIASLQPDLILGSKLRADKLYPQLSQIAPTVFSIRPGFPWKENFRLVGDALGQERQAAAVLDGYRRKVEGLKGKMQGDPTVSLVRFMPGKIRLYGNKSLIGVILKDAGIKRPPNQDVDDLATEVSAENIAQADADRVFYSSYGTPQATGESAVTAGAAWKSMKAVEKGNAVQVSDDLWFLGLGPIGAGRIVDELGTHLAAKK